jgi:hypothetical protein
MSCTQCAGFVTDATLLVPVVFRCDRSRAALALRLRLPLATLGGIKAHLNQLPNRSATRGKVRLVTTPSINAPKPIHRRDQL